MKRTALPGWATATVTVAAFGALVLFELRGPLRRAVESKLRRNARNFAVAGVSAAALLLAERPIIQPLAAIVERNSWGMLKWSGVPFWLEVPLVVILMDYTIYIWHILLHRVPLPWRFHIVHHVDLDLDTSTALRFHFTELLVSVPWRAAQVILIGVSPFSFSVWQTLFFLSVMFHHSNVQLSIKTERFLNRFIVTPRMHGIHHSVVREETNSNWSSGLTLWDRLHKTLRLDIPQQEITIGVPAYQDPKDVTLPKILTMPFSEQRPSWQLPGGAEPTRLPGPGRGELA